MAYLDQPIDEREIKALMSSYGQAEVQQISVEIDAELYENRFLKSAERRGEVVFAIHTPQGILLHRKAFYGDHVFRLPSGGIDYGERVIDALHREIREETNLSLSTARFVGVQDAQLLYAGHSIRFVSYVFYVHAKGELRADAKEQIVELRFVPPVALHETAEALRRTPPPHDGWGRWRALAHDLVYEWLIHEEHTPARK